MVATPEELQRDALEQLHPSIPDPPGLTDDGWPQMGDDAWHGLAGDIVAAVAPHTEADPVAVLMSVLTAFGNAIGPGAYMTADAAQHPARLFTCIVGRSSKARKGTSWRQAEQVFKIADSEWTAHRVQSGASSGEGLIAAVKDPDIGESGQEIPNSGVSDKRLLVLEEEFARVLAVAKRESSTLSAVIRNAYDTGNLRVMTKSPARASGAHMSMVGHITVEELQMRLTDIDMTGGFANRFMFVLVRRGELRPNGGNIDPAELNALGARLGKTLWAARDVGEMRRTPTADRLWDAMYRRMATDDPPGMLGALVARPESHTLRLSVAYALLDGSHVIDVHHLKAAWAVWCYVRQSTEQIFADPTGGMSKPALRLFEAIKDAGFRGLTFKEQSNVFNRNLSSKDLENLRIELGDIICTRTFRGAVGAPTKTCYLSSIAPPDSFQATNEDEQ